MSDSDQLLRKFMTEGLNSIKELKAQNDSIQRELKAQNDSIQRELTDLKISVSTINEQLTNVIQTFSAGQARLEREGEALRQKWDKNQSEVSELDKRITALENRQDKERLRRMEAEIIEVSKRMGKVETQQHRWLGGLAVVGVVVGFVISVLLQALKTIWP